MFSHKIMSVYEINSRSPKFLNAKISDTTGGVGLSNPLF